MRRKIAQRKTDSMRYAFIVAVFSSVFFACESDKLTDTAQDLCPDDPYKTAPGICGCGVADVVDAIYGIYTCQRDMIDLCPNDDNKTEPGVCGCGVVEMKKADGSLYCQTPNIDLCPDDANKTLPGICGCGVPDDLNPETNLPSCLNSTVDLCPDDDSKTLPGVCGCGTPDNIDPMTGLPACLDVDLCPNDPEKTRPGVCGCGSPDIDTDGDTILDCNDQCPEDAGKTEAGVCGCGVEDSPSNIADSDGDGVPNCLDACRFQWYKSSEDGCECDSIFFSPSSTASTEGTCALVIENARDFVDVRDRWNNGLYGADTSVLAFTLVNDIQLGDAISDEEALSWVGIGTEQRPFNGRFIEGGHAIEGVRETATGTTNVTFGNGETSNLGLFGYVDAAQIEDLTMYKLQMNGKDYVGVLGAHISNSVLKNIRVSGSSVRAERYGGGIASVLKSSSLSTALVDNASSVSVTEEMTGGVVAEASGAQLSDISVDATVNGGRYTGGIAGRVEMGGRLVDLYAGGAVSGGQYTGGILGELTDHSVMYNAYSLSSVACRMAPCAAFIARISGYTTIKTAYTSGMITDEREQPMPEAPEKPDNSEETPDMGNDESAGEGAGSQDGDASANPTQPPEDPQEKDVQIPIAMLIASVGSADNFAHNMYYWSETDVEAMPKLEVSGISAPIAFIYRELRPVVVNTGELLVKTLNNDLSCKGGSCTIDGFACLQWIDEKYLLTGPAEEQTTTVQIPRLRIGR